MNNPVVLDSSTEISTKVQEQVQSVCSALHSQAMFLYEISRRPLPCKVTMHSCIAPESTYRYLKDIGLPYQTQEYMLALILDIRNQITGHYVLTKGLLDRSLIHPREVFRLALMTGASKIILAHNHPS